MLYGPLSKFVDTAEAAVVPGETIAAEGLAMVRVNSAQSAGVKPSTGAATDKFCGFSIAGTSAAPFAEGYATKVESFVVPASGIIALQFAPVTGQAFLYDVTDETGDTTPTVSGSTITGLTAGNEVVVTYKYALSVIQARALAGDVQPGGYSGAHVGQIGLVKRGLIYTSEFNASVDWSAATSVYLAAGGQLAASGNVAIDAVIVSIPGAETPYLGIEFSAP